MVGADAWNEAHLLDFARGHCAVQLCVDIGFVRGINLNFQFAIRIMMRIHFAWWSRAYRFVGLAKSCADDLCYCTTKMSIYFVRLSVVIIIYAI